MLEKEKMVKKWFAPNRSSRPSLTLRQMRPGSWAQLGRIPNRKSNQILDIRFEAEKSDGDVAEFEVQSILDMRSCKNGREFRIRWKGYSPNSDCGEPECNLSCDELEFLKNRKVDVDRENDNDDGDSCDESGGIEDTKNVDFYAPAQ